MSPPSGEVPGEGRRDALGAQEDATVLVYTGPDTDTQLRALHHHERITEKQVYTGPDTGAQLIALRYLERANQKQQVYTGPDTSAQLTALRYLERISTEQAFAPGTEVNGFGAAAESLATAPELAVEPPTRVDEIPAGQTAQRRRDERRIVRAARELLAVPWTLYAVLAVQSALSLRFIWSNTAFLDEAGYIWAGRIELWHLTRGTPVPSYATYFSGAPTIYPPIAGLADMLGGLAAARLVSLAFMLGVTCMLWGTTRALFGQRAALCATALFAAIGSTQFLGSLATYDAMALFLLVLSVRLVVAAKDHGDSSLLLIGAVAALALSNATKYATGLFDPVVVAVAVLISPRGLKAGMARGGLIATITIGLISLLLALGGPLYVVGLEFSTLARAAGGSPPSLVLEDSVRWVGVVVAIAFAAIALGWWRDRPQAWLLAALAVSGLLVPLNQARIHTTVSLLKHVDFGAWFACIAAGYALALLTRVSRRAWLRGALAAAAAAVILVPAGAPGRAQASGFNRSWPNTTQLMSRFGTLARVYPGVYLAEDYEVPGYYLDTRVPWQDWQSTWYFGYRAPGSRTCLRGATSGLTSTSAVSTPVGRAYAEAIKHGYFAMILLSFTDTPGIDHAIKNDIDRYGTYHVVAVVPFDNEAGNQFVIWARTATGSGGARGASC